MTLTLLTVAGLAVVFCVALGLACCRSASQADDRRDVWVQLTEDAERRRTDPARRGPWA